MINIEKTSVFNIENALRGARNPKNSWNKMDSGYNEKNEYILGEADLKLLKTLRLAGSDHRKFMRQIFVSADITAPIYWWKEFDTYKVGTTANSQSTMHKIHSKPFSVEDFSCDKLEGSALNCLAQVVGVLEKLRLEFNETKNKDKWYAMIQLLPSSYRQLRTCTMTYENLVNMFNARKNHKLDEWRVFCRWALELPYGKELIAAE